MEEVFKAIEGYERLYEVSNLGRVRSLGNDRKRKDKILRPQMTKKGYLRVALCKEGKGKMFSVHRLVAQAFIPNPEELPQINHTDEDKTNNRVDNLEWCTAKYNSNYGTRLERRVQTMISKGIYDPEMCGILKKDKKEYYRMYMREYYQKNIEKVREYQREYQREQYRLKKKQGKKDNRPSEESLW